MTEGPDLTKGQPEQQNPYGAQGGYPQYGQPPYGQPPYGQPLYGQPGLYGAYPITTPDHPQATTVLILGVVAIVACQLTGPFAWVMGNRVLREIDANPQHFGGRSTANVGRILGIVATALIGLALLIVLVAIVGIIASA